ncbi:ysgA [Symbiodinium natans]|uniref:YsgA protein n=1 Tax=Symbiodinium natans TaxID=878477 RepID=A0A812J8Z0_9DINO|nr:ysgA [Symbiodinium natans]
MESSEALVPEAAAPSKPKEPKRPESFLLIYNVSKKQNFGTLLRSACAFGVSEVLVVGAKKISTFGNQGTAAHANVRHFDTLQAAKDDLRSRGAQICGIEIDDTAQPVTSHPFGGSTAFMLGNEGEGMSTAQKEVCDSFVYIPQFTGATASLNVAIAGSIVLHHFATWAGMQEHPRSGEKFVVEAPRGTLEKFQNPTEAEREEMERKRAERAAKRRKEQEPEEAETGDGDSEP